MATKEHDDVSCKVIANSQEQHAWKGDFVLCDYVDLVQKKQKIATLITDGL